MSSFNGDFARLPGPIYSLLRLCNARYRLESHAENDVVAVGDAPLDAARIIGRSGDLAVLINKGIVGLGAFPIRQSRFQNLSPQGG